MIYVHRFEYYSKRAAWVDKRYNEAFCSTRNCARKRQTGQTRSQTAVSKTFHVSQKSEEDEREVTSLWYGCEFDPLKFVLRNGKCVSSTCLVRQSTLWAIGRWETEHLCLDPHYRDSISALVKCCRPGDDEILPDM